jgi:hypothetical protein
LTIVQTLCYSNILLNYVNVKNSGKRTGFDTIPPLSPIPLVPNGRTKEKAKILCDIFFFPPTTQHYILYVEDNIKGV